MYVFGSMLIDQCKYQRRGDLSAALFALVFKLVCLAPAPGGHSVPVNWPQAVSGSAMLHSATVRRVLLRAQHPQPCLSLVLSLPILFLEATLNCLHKRLFSCMCARQEHRRGCQQLLLRMLPVKFIPQACMCMNTRTRCEPERVVRACSLARSAFSLLSSCLSMCCTASLLMCCCITCITSL